MRLLVALAVLFALGGVGGVPAGAMHAYSVPSCHGLAAVPGYEKCKG